MTTPPLRVRDLVVRYRAPRGPSNRPVEFDAVVGVDLDLAAGEVVGIVGESGSGKSTLARAIVGLTPVASGSVQLAGREVTQLGVRELRALRQDAQFVFQDPYASLNPRMSVGRAIERPLILHSGLDRAARRARVLELLVDVGLPAAVARRYPSECSGGMRQRIAIARALASSPRVLVADEPTASLDASLRAQILNLLARLVREHDLALLMITHDFGAVRAIADRVLVMHLGELVERGTVDEVIANPLHPYTRALLSAVPSAKRRVDTRERLVGRSLSLVDPPGGCRLHPRCPVAHDDCATTVQELRTIAPGRDVRCRYQEASAPKPTGDVRPASPVPTTEGRFSTS